jgi:hypothetical protein
MRWYEGERLREKETDGEEQGEGSRGWVRVMVRDRRVHMRMRRGACKGECVQGRWRHCSNSYSYSMAKEDQDSPCGALGKCCTTFFCDALVLSS